MQHSPLTAHICNCFDSQKRLAAAEWFLDFGVNFLSFYELTAEKDEMNLRATLRQAAC